MENISTSTSPNNSVPSLSSMEVPPRADGIALCSAFVFEAVLTVAGNLLTIAFFAMKKKLRKKSLLLVINMAFADVMLGAVSLPLYIYLWVGPHFNLWSFRASLELSFFICDTIFSQASLISAVFISCERFFAIFWPLKHKTLSMRAHRIAVFMVWTLAIIVSTMTIVPIYLLSKKHAWYIWVSFPLTYLVIVCCCNRHLEKVSKATLRFTNRANQCHKKQTFNENVAVSFFHCRCVLVPFGDKQLSNIFSEVEFSSKLSC